MQHYLRTGIIKDRKITRPTFNAAKPLPAKRRRLQCLAARQHKRDRYYGHVAERLDRGEPGPNPSPWVVYHVDQRSAAYSRGR